MLKVFLFIVLISVCAYFRFNYDMRYVVPVIKEKKDLSISFIVVVASLLTAAIISFFLRMTQLACILVIAILPIVLYLNVKSNWIGISNFFNRKDSN